MKFDLHTVVVGAGNMGSNHARILSKISHLVAIVDKDISKAKPLAAKYHCHFYENLDSLLIQKHQLDAVVVAAPTMYHYELAHKLIKNNISTLVEKPITPKPTQAITLLKLAKQHGVCLSVGHIERFNPAIQHLKKMVQNGLFGEIDTIITRRVGLAPPKGNGLDVVLELGIHDIDLINYLTGENSVSINIDRRRHSAIHLADSAIIMINYPHSSGIIHVNWITPVKRRMIYLTGSRTSAEINLIKQQIITFKSDPEIAQNLNFHQATKIFIKPEYSLISFKDEPLKNELTNFLEQVMHHKPNYQITEAAIMALKLALTST